MAIISAGINAANIGTWGQLKRPVGTIFEGDFACWAEIYV